MSFRSHHVVCLLLLSQETQCVLCALCSRWWSSSCIHVCCLIGCNARFELKTKGIFGQVLQNQNHFLIKNRSEWNDGSCFLIEYVTLVMQTEKGKSGIHEMMAIIWWWAPLASKEQVRIDSTHSVCRGWGGGGYRPEKEKERSGLGSPFILMASCLMMFI